TIPADWEETYKTFNELIKTENTARLTFWRTADGAYETVVEALATLDANDSFMALEADLRALQGIIETAPPDESEVAANDLAKAFGGLSGADDVEKALKDSRRALRSRTPDLEKAIAAYGEAVAAFEAQQQWRGDAAASLKPGLESYRVAITDTIGARQQQRLSEDQALYIAGCSSGHRDLSLNF
ncbi:MAG: C4-dicarboxylate ABC transporter permease, partial [Pseudomonadota bacterium]